MRLKLSLFTGIDGVTMPPMVGKVLGEPNSQLPRMPKIEAEASLSLVRLTSTKRISVCTWLGSNGSSEGTDGTLVSADVALPLTNTMLWRGVFEQAVQTIRLVVPGAMPVSMNALLPLGCTSAIFGSPTASCVTGTGLRSSFCSPWPTSYVDGQLSSCEQLAGAA
ncbi:hypothetical protein D9M71_454510 [compost metagenome]